MSKDASASVRLYYVQIIYVIETTYDDLLCDVKGDIEAINLSNLLIHIKHYIGEEHYDNITYLEITPRER